MSREDILDMLKELVSEIDYGLYKELFCDGAEEPDLAEDTVERLVEIVEEYLEKASDE